ncbi:MAG TPA: GlsB/YeaQ/YmgE family stress response membrane protein [Acidimicrobiia bacterium]|nr:GlsB/YeaQ/YmgE family stress response membrane protein [Acidimicrobiia bacterium]
MVGLVISLFFIGLIAGFLARLFVPGRDPMGFWGTVLLGVLGSFAGGFLGWAVFGDVHRHGALPRAGIIGSIIGAVILLLIYRAVFRRRSWFDRARGF